ncbi:MAG TPA: hypothetical protein ENG34_01300, partial [Candidatus Aenigmarchaeota archaeon]|nr:hypothetical protein [Candidatus Aenigmarchaeota archaeon]
LKAFVKEKNIPHMLFAGPAGTGKCVVSSTPILTSTGVKPVKDVNVNDFVVSLLPNGKFGWRRVVGKISRKCETVKIVTKSGNSVTVSLEHPFLVLRKGLPVWKKASNLRCGDFVATPEILESSLNLSMDFSKVEDLWVKLKKCRKVEVYKLFTDSRQKVLKALWNHKLSIKEISELTDLKYQTVQYALSRLVSSGFVRRDGGVYTIIKKFVITTILPYESSISMEEIDKISTKQNGSFSSWIKPFGNSEEFYEWLGYLLSEGRVEEGRITFFNMDQKLLGRFAKLTRTVFGLNPLILKDRVLIRKSGTIKNILEELFNVYTGKRKSYHIKVPSILFIEKKRKIASFIRAYFDGDGHFSPRKNEIEICSNSREVLIGIKNLLLRFGIRSFIYKKKNSYKLLITGVRNIRKFAREIGSLKVDFKIQDVKENSNLSIPFASDAVKYIMKRLSIKYADLFDNEKKLEYLFERNRGSPRKVKEVYRRLVKLSRKRILLLLELLGELEDILSIDAEKL